MVDQFRSWFKDNQTLIMFLGAQLVALGAGATAILAYSVKLETRVSIMETRGAEYTVDRMNRFDQRITVLEQMIRKNEADIAAQHARIDRLVGEYLKDRK
jgi:exopolysaccharide biosynthesis protein